MHEKNAAQMLYQYKTSSILKVFLQTPSKATFI